MMQNGLHIGLAAWINEQRNTGSFPVYPALPVQTELVNLEAIQDVHDLAKAAEFSWLVNFIPRQGQVADTFSSSAVLWRVHRDILVRMDHATEAWTSVERNEYQAAWDILYTFDASGLPVPSQKHLLYEEMRSAYQDLNNSGGSSDEIAQAMANWLVLGNKHLIEDAFEVMGKLSARSSRLLAQNGSLLLMEDPPGVGLRHYGDMVFAPVYFSPISAISRENWMEAKVSFTDLDRAVGDDPANDLWKAFRANRTGEVLFDYIVLNCIRPWFTPEIYQADDWKLSADDTMVSKGNGTEGLMPAYVDAAYLVSVKNVTSNPKPSQPKPEPKPILRPFGTANIVRGELSQPNLPRKSTGHTDLNIGVVKKAVNTPTALRTVSIPSSLSAPRPVSNISISTTASEHFVALKRGMVKKVTTVDLKKRYTMAQAYLARVTRTPPTPTEETAPTKIYVAGFGCVKVPFAPNPNINYQWT